MPERVPKSHDSFITKQHETFEDPTHYFGEQVFNDYVMRTRLSSATYNSLKETIDAGEPLDSSIAGEVAAAMKQWAVEKGATHYTHWFMPLTGTTGEKHDAFIQPTTDGHVILEFSGKALIKGEPDASSFPSGGLRRTDAARGYTAWDCTSPAFVKDGTLYIPTAFFSHTGEVLDKRAPLLRSVEALNRQAMRILRLFGNTTARKVVSTIGPEQEYFIIDAAHYAQRPDLRYTGRTLFGARSPKGQELSDQYYGELSDRIVAFMHDLDVTLWRLGVSAHTKHNEVAPSQHELAIVFDPSSVAADNNMLVMETLEKVAIRHGLVCLLHEKPFAGLSGSGKHVNWSLATDEGENLLEAGNDVTHNYRFMLFLGAIIAALDTHGDLLLLSISTPANEHRLGSHEAPPAILSMNVGQELQTLIECIENDLPLVRMNESQTNLGVSSMSLCTVDTTDRNRTSPFAYSGNRFEFRMPGSSINVAGPCFILNTIVAQSLSDIADELTGAEDVETAALRIFKSIILRHKRILYDGDNYATTWSKEAERRGLLRLDSAVEAIHRYIDDKNIKVLEAQNVLTSAEVMARHDVLLEHYANVLGIEARTAIDMVKQGILPACMSYLRDLAETVHACKQCGLISEATERQLAYMIEQIDCIDDRLKRLETALTAANALPVGLTQAHSFSSEVKTAMDALREVVDETELNMPQDQWPYPSYGEMLYHI
ncbi:MAG TPA: glutamine synthetase type III [Clostridiaceae bacterium]|nr:glutamine synthetase type III [Clostridiaceae bacterium]